MLPPKIVLLVGKEGNSLQEIKRSLTPSYQVVVFDKLEKEITWFNPIAVVLNQNGSSPGEVLGRLHRLKQIKPDAPILLCSSGERGELEECPPGVEACVSWPDGYWEMKTHLHRLENGHSKWEAGLQRFLKKARKWLGRGKEMLKPNRPATSIAGMPADETTFNGLLLGRFQLTFQGDELSWISSEINRAMLAYVLYHSPKQMLRHKIIDGFWPDSNEQSARNCLNVAISHLRRYFEKHLRLSPSINYRENAYYLNLPYAYRIDAHEFLRYWEQARSLERSHRFEEALDAYRRATRLYRGDFMECINRDIEWVESTRSKLKEIFLAILDRMSELLMEKELCQEAIEACQRILEIDDCIESAHRRLMQCYFHNKNRRMALRQYERCSLALNEKLGAAPSSETIALYQDILEGKKYPVC